MKTTINIEDVIFEKLKEISRKNNISLKKLVEKGLLLLIEDEKSKSKQKYKLKDGSVGEKGLVKEVEDFDWSEIRALSYGDRE